MGRAGVSARENPQHTLAVGGSRLWSVGWGGVRKPRPLRRPLAPGGGARGLRLSRLRGVAQAAWTGGGAQALGVRGRKLCGRGVGGRRLCGAGEGGGRPQAGNQPGRVGPSSQTCGPPADGPSSGGGGVQGQQGSRPVPHLLTSVTVSCGMVAKLGEEKVKPLSVPAS